ncbi:MAG: hypothetical protein ACR2GR_00760, partial [Rhodothermales bacterium]
FNRDEANLRATWADRQDAFVSSYDASETMWPEFLTWLDTEGFLGGEGEATPDSSSQEDADTTAASANLSIEGVEEYRDILQTRLKAYLARDLYGSEAQYPISLQTDPTFNEAMKLWERASTLTSR